MPHIPTALARLSAAAGPLAVATAAQLEPIPIQVTITNLAPTNSISFASLHLGSNHGSFGRLRSGRDGWRSHRLGG